MDKFNNLYNILYNKVWNGILGDKIRRRRLNMLCVFLFGCVCGICNKLFGKLYVERVDINKKLELLDKKKLELVEFHKNLEGVKNLLNELKNELEEKKKC